MNWVDLVLLGVFLFALHLGYQKGFVRQAAALGSLIVGVCLAGSHHATLARSEQFAYVAREYGEDTALVAAYLGIFAAVVLGSQVIATVIRHAIKGKALEHVDSVAGGIVGLVKVYIVCGILALGILEFLPDPGVRRHLSESYFMPKIARSVDRALDQIPPDIRARVEELLNRNSTRQGPSQPAYAVQTGRQQRERPQIRGAARG